MTMGAKFAIPPGMGRKKRWHDVMGAKFPAGTFERIAAVLEDDEDRTDFVRAAVAQLLERREAVQKRKRSKGRKS